MFLEEHGNEATVEDIEAEMLSLAEEHEKKLKDAFSRLSAAATSIIGVSSLFLGFGFRFHPSDLLRDCSGHDEEYNDGNFQRRTWKNFTYQQVFRATNGFTSDNLVGKGGYAEVYKGVLEDGQEIAVKRLTKVSNDERKDKEFLTEIGTLGHVNHSLKC
ncbi:hypothetical protein POM88_017414 [Heracleum sosnowskyi]|uniref:Protein kinase domain-containing protein n=1 Tax=Heracleum sosnowskyi TaxID=360622 RepID=A0AAD8MY30_9APIA|nr:hypothetical protein POM88_017414 [Heracleum sosnowskyi]